MLEVNPTGTVDFITITAFLLILITSLIANSTELVLNELLSGS